MCCGLLYRVFCGVVRVKHVLFFLLRSMYGENALCYPHDRALSCLVCSYATLKVVAVTCDKSSDTLLNSHISRQEQKTLRARKGRRLGVCDFFLPFCCLVLLRSLQPHRSEHTAHVVTLRKPKKAWDPKGTPPSEAREHIIRYGTV